ncbi:MAG: alpha/beta fold hydrolase [Haloarcula sp.]
MGLVNGTRDSTAWTVPASETPGTHEMVDTNGIRLHTVTAGPADGDLVLLLHGFPEFWYAWKHQIPGLADAGYRVVAPDLRGYNHSDKPDGVAAYHIDELVGDVAGLVSAFDREQAHIVGHDWGGVVAWQTAIDRPDIVDKLAVLNAPHPSAYEREIRRSLDQLLRSWYVLFFQLPVLPETSLRWNDFSLLEQILTDGPTHPDAFTDTDVERYKQALGQPGARTAAVNYYRALARRNAVLTVTQGGVDDRPVTAPTLLVWGVQDDALSLALTHDLDEWVPDCRVERLPAASHWVQFDAPETVSDLLLSHLP